MALVQNTPSNQAGGGSAGGTPGAGILAEDAAGAGSADPVGTTAGHTTAGAGTAADLGDIFTDGDGAYAGDPDAGTDGADMVDPNPDRARG